MNAKPLKHEPVKNQCRQSRTSEESRIERIIARWQNNYTDWCGNPLRRFKFKMTIRRKVTIYDQVEIYLFESMYCRSKSEIWTASNCSLLLEPQRWTRKLIESLPRPIDLIWLCVYLYSTLILPNLRRGVCAVESSWATWYIACFEISDLLRQVIEPRYHGNQE